MWFFNRSLKYSKIVNFFFFILLVFYISLEINSFFFLNLKYRRKSIFFLILKLLIYFVIFKSKFLVEAMPVFHGFVFFCLFFALNLCFWTKKIFFFFVFMEVSLIPMVCLILGWGLKPERPLASSYLFLYTFLGSLPLLIKILFFYFFTFSFNILFFYRDNTKIIFFEIFDRIIWLIVIGSLLGFFIKLPVFGLHSWLPKAHVEASTLGSVILASVLLKLGVFGILLLKRFLPLMIIVKEKSFILLWIACGYLVCGFFCLRFVDFKVLIAYSSIVHMSFIGASLLLFRKTGFLGCLLVSISHGLIRGGLFYLVGSIYWYRRSRSLLLNNGWTHKKNILYLLLVCYISLNFSFPPFLSFCGEILLIRKVIKSFFSLLLIVVLGVLFRGLYKLLIFSYISHGKGFIVNKVFLSFFFFLFFLVIITVLRIFSINYFF